MKNKLTSKGEDSSKWYLEIIQRAGLAENSEVAGCMVIKPYGYALWENIRDILDKQFKRTGHRNAYFPLFIPMNYLSKEAKHAEGFATECAIVTHYRLRAVNGELEIDPDAKLGEPLIVRPTSEAIIWHTYKNWINSYRDLPILINQWANVVRMEKRTRPFLRTTEFLWQEGHTAHATREDAMVETLKMLDVYAEFSQNVLAIPVIKGVKTANERFAGADETYCIEGLMQDGKAIQMGTSHFLGQNFAKSFDVTFTTAKGEKEFVFATSWGVSTRLIGSLILAHSDDYGLVLPPKIAPIKVVIVPVISNNSDIKSILQICEIFKSNFEKQDISCEIDNRDNLIPKQKFMDWEMKGVPVRIELGQREVNAGNVILFRRDLMKKDIVPLEGIVERVQKLLGDIQNIIYCKALQHQRDNTFSVDSFENFKEQIESGGLVRAHWDGTTDTEQKIKELTKATIRCIPIGNELENGKCILTQKPSNQRVVFAKAY